MPPDTITANKMSIKVVIDTLYLFFDKIAGYMIK
jgi:hypothetical protein